MAAAMNGMALHGGLIPYGGTFLVFSDYCRPAIRLAALMAPAGDLRDDPRFDRARRGRPDPPAGRASGGAARDPEPARVPAGRRGRDRRVLGAGAAARDDGPSVLALTRQKLPALRTSRRPRTARRAAPMCWPRPTAARQVTLLATGSEVALALAARDALAGRRHPRAPSSRCRAGSCSSSRTWPIATQVLGAAPRVAVEAAVRFGWTR